MGRRRALLSLATGTGKTFIAFNFTHKLLATGYARRVLFIADRISLRDQAYNEFGGFGDRRGVVNGPDVPLARDVHFGIYQTLYADAPGGGKVYERYPRDYFDVVIIDECHRSGYGDWGAILDYFDGAFHLGMTATPKQDDSVDTYAYFASENKDAEGVPRPIYEYSLGRGIDDGFLATYKVLKVRTSVDEGLVIQDEVERGAELIVPEGTTAAGRVRDARVRAGHRRAGPNQGCCASISRACCAPTARWIRPSSSASRWSTLTWCAARCRTCWGSETGKNLVRRPHRQRGA